MSRLLNGIRNGLLMSSSAGEGGGAPAGGGGAPDAGAFVASLPEDLRSHAAFKDIPDAPTLARRYADTQKPWAIPEKYTKDNPALKDFKDLDSFVGSYVNTAKLVGADKGRVALLPKDDKDEAGYEALYKTLGRPESADKYVIGEKRADGKPYAPEDIEFQKGMAPLLHKAGISQRQLDALRPAWDGMVDTLRAAQDTATAKAAEETAAALRGELKENYDAQLGLAKDALKHYSDVLKLGDTVAKELDDTKLGNNPGIFKLLAHMGAQLKEDGLLGKGGAPGGEKSVDAAKAEIAKLENDAEFGKVYRNKQAPGHAEAVAKVAELYKIVYPPKQPGGA